MRRRVGWPSHTLTAVPLELCVRHVRCVVSSFRTQTVALRLMCGSNPITPRRHNIRVTCAARRLTAGLSQLLTAMPVCACCPCSERSLLCLWCSYSRFFYIRCDRKVFHVQDGCVVALKPLPSCRMRVAVVRTQTYVPVLAPYRASYVCRLKP